MSDSNMSCFKEDLTLLYPSCSDTTSTTPNTCYFQTETAITVFPYLFLYRKPEGEKYNFVMQK